MYSPAGLRVLAGWNRPQCGCCISLWPSSCFGCKQIATVVCMENGNLSANTCNMFGNEQRNCRMSKANHNLFSVRVKVVPYVQPTQFKRHNFYFESEKSLFVVGFALFQVSLQLRQQMVNDCKRVWVFHANYWRLSPILMVYLYLCL